MKGRSKQSVDNTTSAADNVPSPDASAILGRALLDASFPTEVLRRLSAEGPYALIVEVPTKEHVIMLSEAVDDLVPEGSETMVLTGPPGLFQADALLQGLAQGKVCVAVTSSASFVPASFAALADDRVKVGPHDPRMLRATIKEVLGQPVPAFPKGFLLHPNPGILCRCIVPGLQPAQVIRAMVRIGETLSPASDAGLPHLSGCPEYGELRAWGLGVIRDIESWKAGTLPSSDLDACCLLTGPPGAGKSYFARVLANSMGVPLFELTAGKLFVKEGHLGNVLQELRTRFAAATAAAPSVLLIDEIDTFSDREAQDSNRSFGAAMVNEMLTLLDGVSGRHPGLVVIGATNLPDIVDPALLRPGRLSRTIELQMPDEDGIENILRTHLRGSLRRKPLESVIRLLGGLTPAAVMNVVKSARQAARHLGREMTVADLERAAMGPDSRDGVLMRRVAVHECGHALASLLLPEAPGLVSVSLIRKGHSMGNVATSRLKGANTRSRIESEVMVLLAGIAAEDVFFGSENRSDGAYGDLKEATELIADMHGRFGMGTELRHTKNRDRRLAEDPDFARKVEDDLHRLSTAITETMEDHRAHLSALAMQLARRRVLKGWEVLDLVHAVEAGRTTMRSRASLVREAEGTVH